MEWVCEDCGQSGQAPPDQHPDTIQCPDCGEPVTPLG